MGDVRPGPQTLDRLEVAGLGRIAAGRPASVPDKGRGRLPAKMLSAKHLVGSGMTMCCRDGRTEPPPAEVRTAKTAPCSQEVPAVAVALGGAACRCCGSQRHCANGKGACGNGMGASGGMEPSPVLALLSPQAVYFGAEVGVERDHRGGDPSRVPGSAASPRVPAQGWAQQRSPPRTRITPHSCPPGGSITRREAGQSGRARARPHRGNHRLPRPLVLLSTGTLYIWPCGEALLPGGGNRS